MSITEIISEISAWQNADEIRFEPLSGGYTNSIYKVYVDDKIYALRINGKQNGYLGLKCEDEFDIIVQAAKHGITPMALKCEKKSAYTITEFVEGEILSVEQLHDHEILYKVIEILKKIHGISFGSTRISTPFSLTRGSLEGAEKLGVPCPAGLKAFLPRLDAIEKKRQIDPEYQQHYCHNDAFNHNMILCPDGSIKMLDWELSGYGDIWFDLATLSFSCGFNRSTDEFMLQSYFGNCDDHKLQILDDIKFACMIREIAWALLTTALNRMKPEPGKEFLDFADVVLDRLKNGQFSLV